MPKPIPIFDSLTHPTLTGTWIDGERDASFETLTADMKRWGFSGACAVGLAGVGDYAHEAFLEACRPHASLVPIAGVDPTDPSALGDELETVKELGFRGIKIHPRLSSWTPTAETLGEVFRIAGANELPVLYCTYRHAPLASYPSEDPFYTLVRALQRAPETRVVLMHGGDVQVMRYSELVRFNETLLLDLSFTMMKYRGSSLDTDLSYLFRRFDRRICIGTDHPEYSHENLRERFDHLCAGLPREKAENIASKNLKTFLGVARTAKA
jgi:predicted TIM-barrel fold metal-dependent hydrolase